jgi:hypothetical protein
VKHPANYNRGPGSARPALTRPPTAEERRRAQRVLLKMAVTVHIPGKAEPVSGVTHTVSENGAMIVLAEPIGEGTVITIENPRTQNRVDAKVARPPQSNHEGSLVPLQFTTAAPHFWGIFFPPAVN